MTVFKRLIRWFAVTKAGDNSGQYPVQQVTYLGKVGDCVMIFPYGMLANVPAGALGPMFAVGGDMDNRAGIPADMANWPQLNEGEVALYNPTSGDIVKMLPGGGIEITGPVTVVGSLAVTGTITNNGTDIGATHTHSGVTPGGGVTGPVV